MPGYHQKLKTPGSHQGVWIIAPKGGRLQIRVTPYSMEFAVQLNGV